MRQTTKASVVVIPPKAVDFEDEIKEAIDGVLARHHGENVGIAWTTLNVTGRRTAGIEGDIRPLALLKAIDHLMCMVIKDTEQNAPAVLLAFLAEKANEIRDKED